MVYGTLTRRWSRWYRQVFISKRMRTRSSVRYIRHLNVEPVLLNYQQGVYERRLGQVACEQNEALENVWISDSIDEVCQCYQLRRTRTCSLIPVRYWDTKNKWQNETGSVVIGFYSLIRVYESWEGLARRPIGNQRSLARSGKAKSLHRHTLLAENRPPDL